MLVCVLVVVVMGGASSVRERFPRSEKRQDDRQVLTGGHHAAPDGTSARSERRAERRSALLEELHGALVALRSGERLECAEILPLAGPRVLLARVETELPRLELPDHAG